MKKVLFVVLVLAFLGCESGEDNTTNNYQSDNPEKGSVEMPSGIELPKMGCIPRDMDNDGFEEYERCSLADWMHEKAQLAIDQGFDYWWAAGLYEDGVDKVNFGNQSVNRIRAWFFQACYDMGFDPDYQCAGECEI